MGDKGFINFCFMEHILNFESVEVKGFGK